SAHRYPSHRNVEPRRFYESKVSSRCRRGGAKGKEIAALHRYIHFTTKSTSKKLADQLLEARARSHDRLRTFRTGRDASDLDAGSAFEKCEVIFRTRRQLGVGRNAERRRPPTGQALEHRFDGFHFAHRGRHDLEFHAARAIGDAHRNLVEFVQYVEL